MIRVQFNGMKTKSAVTFKAVTANRVKLLGKYKPKDTGFQLYRLNGDLLGDYSDFTEYSECEGGYIFKRVYQ